MRVNPKIGLAILVDSACYHIDDDLLRLWFLLLLFEFD